MKLLPKTRFFLFSLPKICFNWAILGLASAPNLFCIEEIIDVVNQDYENVVFINDSELLKRTHYNWFCNLSKEDVITCDNTLGDLFRLSV